MDFTFILQFKPLPRGLFIQEPLLKGLSIQEPLPRELSIQEHLILGLPIFCHISLLFWLIILRFTWLNHLRIFFIMNKNKS